MEQAGAILIFVTLFLGLLATSALGLRLYCRYYQKARLTIDDYLIIIALLLSWSVSIASDYVAATTGVGNPSYVPDEDTVIFASKVNYFTENTSITVMGLVKVALLLFYKRIFVTKTFNIAANFLIAITASFSLAVLLAIVFSKWPIKDQWNPEVPFNINIPAILIFYVAFNATLDLFTLALPLTAVRALQMSKHRKNVLSIIFTLGSLCVIASFLRLHYAVEYAKVKPTPSSFFEAPFIYNGLWAIIEQPVFILANCLLTLGPLYHAKYGPANWLSPLQSLLLPSSSKRSSAKNPANMQKKKNGGCNGCGLQHDIQPYQWERLPNIDAGSNSSSRRNGKGWGRDVLLETETETDTVSWEGIGGEEVVSRPPKALV
ncbi:MAG: hypothetical protein Q9227_006825 [Pyrenula ochraceoflavens]